MRCEARTLDDIRALGGNEGGDERRFAHGARVSEANLAALSRLRAAGGPRHGQLVRSAEWLRRLHPAAAAVRAVFGRESDGSGSKPWPRRSARIEAGRRGQSVPRDAGDDVQQIVTGARRWRDTSETLAERTFLRSTACRRCRPRSGIDPAVRPLRSAKNPLHRELLERRIAELAARIPAGGMRKLRSAALIYVGLSRRALTSADSSWPGASVRRTATCRSQSSRRSFASSSTCC